MVLERLVPERFLEQRFFISIILGFFLASVGMIIGSLLFGVRSGIASIIFTTIFLLPIVSRLLKKEEMAELREHTVTSFLRDNGRAFGVYASIFIGIFLAYLFYSFYVPWLGHRTEGVFIEQLIYGSGIFGADLAIAFLQRWWILLACFLIALAAGEGALFFVVWNASVWGALVGGRAILSTTIGTEPWIAVFVALLLTLPSLLLEGSAYILAMIAGGIISDEVVTKQKVLDRFLFWSVPSVVVIVAAHFLLVTLLSFVVLVFVDLFLVLASLFLLSFLFRDAAHRRVFRYNLGLFAFSFVLFCFGAFVNTLLFSVERNLLS